MCRWTSRKEKEEAYIERVISHATAVGRSGERGRGIRARENRRVIIAAAAAEHYSVPTTAAAIA